MNEGFVFVFVFNEGFSYSKIQRVQLAVHGNKLAVHCTALPQRSAATGDKTS